MNQTLRRLQQLEKLEKKQVKMPVRTKLNQDETLTAYYRETLLLFAQNAQYFAEQFLDSEISVHERVTVQKLKNNIDEILFGIVDKLHEKNQDVHYDRMAYLIECHQLLTLVRPKHFDKMKFVIEKEIRNTKR